MHRRPIPLIPAGAFVIFSQHTPVPRRGRQLLVLSRVSIPITAEPFGLVRFVDEVVYLVVSLRGRTHIVAIHTYILCYMPQKFPSPRKKLGLQ